MYKMAHISEFQRASEYAKGRLTQFNGIPLPPVRINCKSELVVNPETGKVELEEWQLPINFIHIYPARLDEGYACIASFAVEILGVRTQWSKIEFPVLDATDGNGLTEPAMVTLTRCKMKED